MNLLERFPNKNLPMNLLENFPNKKFNNEYKMKKEVITQLTAFVTAAFGLVAALAWNSAIQAIFTSVFGTANGIAAMLIYAIIVTAIAVLVTIRLSRMSEKVKDKNE